MSTCCSQWRKHEEEEETIVRLPSEGVRLEPPFFPSSPCCEYCFRRFWALRMVPETESRGGRGRTRRKRRRGRTATRARQPSNTRTGRRERERERQRSWKWNTDTSTETGSRGVGSIWVSVGGGATAWQHRKSQVRAQEATRGHVSSCGFGEGSEQREQVRSGVKQQRQYCHRVKNDTTQRSPSRSWHTNVWARLVGAKREARIDHWGQRCTVKHQVTKTVGGVKHGQLEVKY